MDPDINSKAVSSFLVSADHELSVDQLGWNPGQLATYFEPQICPCVKAQICRISLSRTV